MLSSPPWRAVGTLAGVVGPAVVALLVWVVAAPRSELLSVGGGRGLRLPESGADGGSQLLMLIVLLGAAVVCAVLSLWHRHPGLRRPGGVPVLVLLPGLTCSVTAAAASPVAALLAPTAENAPYGTVVAQPPTAGALFFDRMIYGTTGPSWDWFPPGAGWLAFGAMIAAFTVAALAHVSHSSELRDGVEDVDGLDGVPPESVSPNRPD
ncbi:MULTISPECIES: hypothetical protein [unclassified Dietzia]|uniref:hypothetical protein n=1 Tax=unclassified Dietzia TaxID=2617939 RepID=UPI001887E352|nr:MULTISPECIES: hypothetical protein [unclassified Dietzia]